MADSREKPTEDDDGGLPARLEWLRQQWSVSLAAMDRIADVAAGSFFNYVKGTRKPGASVVRALCLAKGVNADWLICGRGEPFSDPVAMEAFVPVARAEAALDSLVKAIGEFGRAIAVLAPALSPSDRNRLLSELAGLISGIDRDPLA